MKTSFMLNCMVMDATKYHRSKDESTSNPSGNGNSLSFLIYPRDHRRLVSDIYPRVLGIGLDKSPPWWDFISHQHAEIAVCFFCVIDSDLAE